MFSLKELDYYMILDGEYSLLLVLLSIVIACAASYTALSLNQRMQQSSFFHKSFWLLLSSIAMGLGIWSMHFVGMSAFILQVSMHYDWVLTFISIIPAVFASYVAFYFANKKKQTHWKVVTAGVVMGFGISGMHYIGMAAMKMEAHYYYRPWLFIGSIAIAIVVSYIALFIFSKLQKYMETIRIKLVTAIIMGLAITSMHYTGMAAVVFYVEDPIIEHQFHSMDMSFQVLFVTIGISLLLIVSGLANFLDRYVDHRLVYFDALTLYPNQRQFEKEIAVRKSSGTLAVIHIHNLKKWIGAHGYSFGDQIVKEVGERLQLAKPISAKIYRIEGNRFAIINYDLSYQSMKQGLESMLSSFLVPMKIDEHEFFIETACAVAHTEEKEDFRDLFANAMAVLQHSTISYENRVIEYDPEVHRYSLEKQLVQDINRAIRDRELYLQYQPKCCSKSLEVTGLEALIRWNHPTYGFISPGVFIPILEENGKIYEVTDWVIEEVCSQLAHWLQEGNPIYQISINIPGVYVTSPKLLHVLKENVLKYKINSSYLELEITETSVIHDMENAIKAVAKYRDLGLSVALDDFGTGLSSLSYLRRIPISTIKIDKSFVDGVPIYEKDSDVLRAIITLCYSLKLNVVIEGVETEQQYSFITSMSETPHIQGYYFSRPLTADDLMSWLKKVN